MPCEACADKDAEIARLRALLADKGVDAEEDGLGVAQVSLSIGAREAFSADADDDEPAAPPAAERKAADEPEPVAPADERPLGPNVSLEFCEDSPMHRQQIEGFEETLADLRRFCSGVAAKCKAHRAGLTKSAETGASWAEDAGARAHSRALFATCFQTELGDLSEVMGTFAETLRQIQSARDILVISLGAAFEAPLEAFVERELREAAELKKEVARLTDEFEALVMRRLSPPSAAQSRFSTAMGSATTPEEDNEALAGARRQLELARFDLVKLLNQLEAKKLFVLNDAVNSALYAHMAFFHGCHEVVLALEARMSERQSALQAAHAAFRAEERQWTRARFQLDRELGGLIGAAADPLAPLSPGLFVLQARRRPSDAAMQAGVVRQGYLAAKQRFQLAQRKRSWYRIHGGKLYRADDEPPVVLCDLKLSTVRPTPAGAGGGGGAAADPFAFELVSPDGSSLVLQAASEADKDAWVDAIRRCTESMLGFDHGDPALRALMERAACADCGAGGPEWASISVGALLCVECAGIHRGLGVEHSKVRSLTLDYFSAWTVQVLVALEPLVNGVWEHTLPDGWAARRPAAGATWEEKRKWITAKYTWHGFVEPHATSEDVPGRLWAAVVDGDVRGVAWALAHGVDVNEADAADEGRTALHKACLHGREVCAELLMINGASLDAVDGLGDSPLATAVRFSMAGVTQLLQERSRREDAGSVGV